MVASVTRLGGQMGLFSNTTLTFYLLQIHVRATLLVKKTLVQQCTNITLAKVTSCGIHEKRVHSLDEYAYVPHINPHKLILTS